MRVNRATKLRLVLLSGAFTFGFVWCLTHGNIVGAIVLAVFSIPTLMVWLLWLFVLVKRDANPRNEPPSRH
jgi:hypothetical protein